MGMAARIDAKIQNLTELKSAIRSLELADECRVYLDLSSVVVVLYADDMAGVAYWRHYLREKLGSWTDQIEFVWASGNTGCASYKSPVHPIEIRLAMPVEQFPHEIMGETCRFEKRTREEYAYTCIR